MNPPTEQLIRDYLNRVSVAARDRLGADQRRALIARTREFIEHNTRAVGQTGSAAVSRLLSELGDPADLVEREREQLNGPVGPVGPVGPAGPAGPAGPGEPGPERSRRGRAARRHLADLMAAQAVAVVPGSESVPEAADDAPLTGEREYQNRPITARWKPGAPMVPKQARPPGARRAAITRRLPGRGRDGGPAQPGAGSESESESADLTGSDLARGDLARGDLAGGDLAGSDLAGSESGAAVPPLPADVRPGRPQWPSLVVRSAGDPPAAANGSAPAIPRPRNGTGIGTAAGPDSSAGTVGPGTAADQGTPVGQSAGAGQGTAAEEAPAGPATGLARPAESAPSADSHTSAGAAGPARPAAPGGAPPGGAPPGGAAPGGAALDGAPEDGAAPAHSVPPADSAAPALAPGTGWARGVRARGTRRMRSALTRGRGVGEQRAVGDPARDRAVAGGPASDPAAAGPGAPAGPRRGRPALPPGLAAATVARARKLAVATAAGARRQPLEATAVVLLGLGGLIYPPVWLMGALVALASRVWDHRDKWIGLGAPVLLVIAGVAADVSLDTESSLLGYLKEAWLFGGHVCRIAALLGAVYLAWRAQRGRRPPTVPPWNKPRRIV